eukprot:10764876-Alexandrium_andersonii.AAC.1
MQRATIPPPKPRGSARGAIPSSPVSGFRLTFKVRDTSQAPEYRSAAFRGPKVRISQIVVHGRRHTTPPDPR